MNITMEPLPRVDELHVINGVPVTELVRDHHAQMLSFARSMGMPSMVAEEIVQEAWLQVIASADRFEGRSSVSTWLLGIVRNLVLNRRSADYRKSSHECAFPEDADPIDGEIHPEGHPKAGHWKNPPQQRFLPEEYTLGNELRTTVEAIIDTLPQRQRQAIVLRDLCGLSAEETAEIMGISDQVLRALLYRARGHLRKQLHKGYFS